MYVSKYCALEDTDVFIVCKYFQVVNNFEYNISENDNGQEVVRYNEKVVKSVWSKATIGSSLTLDSWRRALKNRLFKVFENDVTLDKIDNCLAGMGFERY